MSNFNANSSFNAYQDNTKAKTPIYRMRGKSKGSVAKSFVTKTDFNFGSSNKKSGKEANNITSCSFINESSIEAVHFMPQRKGTMFANNLRYSHEHLPAIDDPK